MMMERVMMNVDHDTMDDDGDADEEDDYREELIAMNKAFNIVLIFTRSLNWLPD